MARSRVPAGALHWTRHQRDYDQNSVGRWWECDGSRSCTCSGGRLIAVVRELESYREIFRSHRCDHSLEIVAALARHADLLVLDLRGHFELGLADEAGDLFGNLGVEALFDFDQL